jgi:hypothetical protein
MMNGACLNTDVDMFPEEGHGVTVAQQLCRQCPVQTTCATYALERGEVWGVWGGLSQRERERIWKAQRRGAA